MRGRPFDVDFRRASYLLKLLYYYSDVLAGEENALYITVRRRERSKKHKIRREKSSNYIPSEERVCE